MFTTLRDAALVKKVGLAMLAATLAMAFLDLKLALTAPVVFLALCLIAPFLHRWSFYLPIISRGRTGRNVIALTFDDGPDPRTTLPLLRLLALHEAQATFFVVGQRVLAYPEVFRAILEAGHTIGNHSFSHDSLVAFKGKGKVAAEIGRAQRILEDFGVKPLVYRPPVGITYPGLAKVLKESGLRAVTFRRRALDRGERAVRHLAQRVLGRVRPDDILLLHDLQPLSPQSIPKWLAELEKILSGVSRKGLSIRPLSELIGAPVDMRLESTPLARAAVACGRCGLENTPK